MVRVGAWSCPFVPPVMIRVRVWSCPAPSVLPWQSVGRSNLDRGLHNNADMKKGKN